MWSYYRSPPILVEKGVAAFFVGIPREKSHHPLFNHDWGTLEVIICGLPFFLDFIPLSPLEYSFFFVCRGMIEYTGWQQKKGSMSLFVPSKPFFFVPLCIRVNNYRQRRVEFFLSGVYFMCICILTHMSAKDEPYALFPFF